MAKAIIECIVGWVFHHFAFERIFTVFSSKRFQYRFPDGFGGYKLINYTDYFISFVRVARIQQKPE